MPRLDFILAAAEERDGDGDLLELEPLELDRELELEEERDPEPLESEAESLERDTLASVSSIYSRRKNYRNSWRKVRFLQKSYLEPQTS